MKYYIIIQNERRGPFTREELTNHARNKILSPTDKIEDENQKQFFAYDLVNFSNLNLHNQNINPNQPQISENNNIPTNKFEIFWDWFCRQSCWGQGCFMIMIFIIIFLIITLINS